jgi:hypothetical protein
MWTESRLRVTEWGLDHPETAWEWHPYAWYGAFGSGPRPRLLPPWRSVDSHEAWGVRVFGGGRPPSEIMTGICRPDVRVFQWPGSVFGARCSALGVDPVPGIGSQVPGIRDLRPGTRTESRYRKGRSGYRWDSRFMFRKTRTRDMQVTPASLLPFPDSATFGIIVISLFPFGVSPPGKGVDYGDRR